MNTFCFNNTPPFHFKYHISRKFQEPKSFGPWQCRPYLIPSRAWQRSFTDAKRKMRLVMGVWFFSPTPPILPFRGPEPRSNTSGILQSCISLPIPHNNNICICTSGIYSVKDFWARVIFCQNYWSLYCTKKS